MWRERQEQSLWLSAVSSCNLTTAISATEGKRKPLCTHTSFFLLTRFSCTTSSLALFRGWLTSFLTDLPEPVSDKLPLSILLSHPLLPLPSCHLSATFFCSTICPEWICLFFLKPSSSWEASTQFERVQNQNQANDKRKHIFLTASCSEFSPGKRFQLIARELFHLLDMHFIFLLLDMPFTPQASTSPGVFHVRSSMPSDKLPPLCEVVAAVQREQAWKQQVGRKRAGKALRSKGTCLNPFHQTPNAFSDEGGNKNQNQ